MVASKLYTFIRLEDNNGIVVGKWAESTETEGIARCKICKCDVNFKQVKLGTLFTRILGEMTIFPKAGGS